MAASAVIGGLEVGRRAARCAASVVAIDAALRTGLTMIKRDDGPAHWSVAQLADIARVEVIG